MADLGTFTAAEHAAAQTAAGTAGDSDTMTFDGTLYTYDGSDWSPDLTAAITAAAAAAAGGGGQFPPAGYEGVPMSPEPRDDVKYGDGTGIPAATGDAVPMTLHSRIDVNVG